jgi:hypothetical protein
MTASEWRACTDPLAMLEELRRTGQGSDRKLRLFAVACSRRLWDWIDELGRAAVSVAERYADGWATPEQLRAARLTCKTAGASAAWYAAASNPSIAARNAALSAQAGAGLAGERVAQVLLLRDLFGNGSCPLLPLDQEWLQASNAAGRSFAQFLYQDGDFGAARMSELADVLQKADGTNAGVLEHCREPGPHVRGCWVVDLLLGKV